MILAGLAMVGMASLAHAAADVKVTNGHVWIHATNAPLPEILERLQEQTGMKVIYDGPRPQQLVAVTIEDQTLTATLSTLLDAHGVQYAVALNAAGTQVATLLITGGTASAGSSPSGASRAPVRQDIPPPPGFAEFDEGAYPPMVSPMEPPPTMPAMPAPPPTMTMTGAPIPSMSGFTPQGPGPVIIPPPGAAPASAPTAPPPVMTPLPGPSTAELPPWEK
jgi:hypothetical protein